MYVVCWGSLRRNAREGSQAKAQNPVSLSRVCSTGDLQDINCTIVIPVVAKARLLGYLINESTD
jgi:hypothetical protein